MRNGQLLRAAFCSNKPLIAEDVIDDMVDRARRWLALQKIGSNTVFGWSGGKDALAVKYILSGISIPFVSTGAGEFEFVEWRRFVQKEETTIYDHPNLVGRVRLKKGMLFPTDQRLMYEWFKMTNQFSWHASGATKVVVGKRTQDGNCCGKNGVFADRTGIIQLSPIVHWKHEHVAALIHYKKLEMNPMYSWFDGYETTDKRWVTRPVRSETNMDFLEYIKTLSPETHERAVSVIRKTDWI